MVNVWWSAAQTDPLQLSESQQTYYVWGVCSANQWDVPVAPKLAASIGPQKGSKSSPWQCPTAHHATNTSKVEQVELWCFASSTIFTWPLVNRLPLVRASWWLFTGKTLPQPAGCKKSCPRVHLILKHRFFFLATGINKLISHWQKCVDSNGSYFD